MSTTVLFARRPIRTGIEGLEFDVAPSETHNRAWKVTDNPVERGAPVSDHIDADPATLTIEGVVTNSPIGLDAEGARPGRAERWWNDMLALLDQLTTVTVVTGLDVYRNMAVTSLSTTRTAMDELRVSMSLKKIRLVESRSIQIPPDVLGEVEASGDAPGTVKDQASSTVDIGTIQTEDLTPEQEAQVRASLPSFLQ